MNTPTVKLSKEDLGKVEAGVVSTSAARLCPAGRCGVCFRRILTFLASTVGLTVLTGAYSALGGYIFMVLESSGSPGLIPVEFETVTVQQTVTEVTLLEAVDRKTVLLSLERHLDSLWNMTEQLNILHKETWKKMAEEVLQRYTDDVYASVPWNRTMRSNDVVVKTVEDVEEDKWNYPEALLYAITVITTIGYGHITPKTKWGMIVTMVYAVFGIPLTFLTIAHLGRFMATAFRFLYRNVCCFLCRRDSCRRSKRPADPNVTREATPCVENGGTKQETEVVTEVPVEKIKIADVKVPISVTVMVLVIYIAIGSLLFTVWEGWNPVEASYFCFITLSTIGFGDYVPGTSIDADKSQEKLLCCAVYLLIGLSFLAMCFDLIQEEVVNKFRRIGRYIGLVQETKDDQ